jgi:SAM-dependent methyltransferase
VTEPPRPPPDVVAYYESEVEVERLAFGLGLLELERTKELLARFLPERARVADVGGATGRYAAWLVDRGHRVELVDPVPLHVEHARREAGEPPRFGVHEADARELPFPDDSFDAVLLLGPLYHLGERDDRLQALREAARVCRPGGVLCAAAISRVAPLLGIIREGRIADEETFRNVSEEVRTGRRVPPERRTMPFPDAFFHRPEELAAELEDAGFAVEGVYGVEGPGWLLRPFDAIDDATFERVLRAAREHERDPALVAVSAHLLAVATRTGAPGAR